jgi:transposase
MLAEDMTIERAASFIGRSVKTLMNWGHHYLTKGIDSLNAFNYKPKHPSVNASQCERLATWVKQTNPAKVKHVKAYLKEQFSVTYTVEAVRQLLHKLGLKRIRPKTVPGKAPSEEDQRAFLRQYEAMKGTYAPGTIVLFLDAMHLVHQNEPGYCWGDPKAPPVMQRNTGRKRLNILGGYNPADDSLIHLTGEETCDAQRVVEFFDRIVIHHRTAPYILMFADHATYFKAEVVTEWLEAHPQVHLEFLPAYAPNLNVIERFWKFAKEHLVKNTYYEKYKTFRAHVFRFLNHVDQYLEALQTRMVEKFQIIQPKTV